MAEAPPTAEELAEFLIDSARYGDTDDVRTALAEGVPVDSVDASGRTALHMAAANGHTAIVSMLVDGGASLNIKNAEGSTPLHWACLNGRTDIVRLLMEKGACVTILNNAGRTPVDEALSSGHEALLELINTFDVGGGRGWRWSLSRRGPLGRQPRRVRAVGVLPVAAMAARPMAAAALSSS